jgi:hypothetical protein
MKKMLLVFAGFVVAVSVFSVAGFAFAQSQTPPFPEYPYGPGMMNEYDGYGPGSDHGMMGGYGMGWNGEEGPMHEAMVEVVAEGLGLTPEEIEARHDAGETILEIAEAEGFSAEEIQDLISSAHDVALEDAVANGLLTQEQADWMDSHMDGMWLGGNHCGNGGTGFMPHRDGLNW